MGLVESLLQTAFNTVEDIVLLIQNVFIVIIHLISLNLTKGGKFLKEFYNFLKPLSLEDYWTLYHVVLESLIPNNITDDRKDRVQYLIVALAKTSQSNWFTIQLKGVLLKAVWNLVNKPFGDVKHPPGHKVDAILDVVPKNYKWRLPDGRGNSAKNPLVGMGYTYYSNEIKGKGYQRLPDPSAVFELVLKREKFIPHPSGMGVLLYYLGAVITHDLFWTAEKPEYQKLVNSASSYLDLQVLYGRTKEEVDAIRTFKNGLIHPDFFANWRLSLQLPGIAVLVVLFSRNHNYIAHKLAQLNEDGRFTPENYSEAYLDEKLFQTARLINCGCYINVIIHDYLRSILGLPNDTDFLLDPRQDPPAADPSHGNQASLGFNFLYRWHSTISEDDVPLLEDIVNQRKAIILSGHIPGLKEIQAGLGIQTLKRTSSGAFADSDLAGVLRRCMKQIAGHPGAQNIPAIFKQFEIDAINQGRNYMQFPTLNEYRAHLHLKTYTKFEEVNPNPKVYNALKKLYQHVNDIELYPGVVSEQTQDPQSGPVNKGMGMPYTIGTGILSDAINVVRNDRFNTIDWTPERVTRWGHDFATDPARVGLPANKGSIMMHFLHNLLHKQFDLTEPNVKEPFRVLN